MTQCSSILQNMADQKGIYIKQSITIGMEATSLFSASISQLLKATTMHRGEQNTITSFSASWTLSRHWSRGVKGICPQSGRAEIESRYFISKVCVLSILVPPWKVKRSCRTLSRCLNSPRVELCLQNRPRVVSDFHIWCEPKWARSGKLTNRRLWNGTNQLALHYSNFLLGSVGEQGGHRLAEH